MACWRFLLLACCVLVFLFALHAKVSVYQQSNHVDTSTSSKLWLSGERHDLLPASASVTLFWFAAVLVFLLCRQSERRYDSVCRAPAPASPNQMYLHRFLRPPPVG
jgi:hypothetical protein